MATVLGFTSLTLDDEQMKTLVDVVGDAVTTGLGLPSTMKSVTFLPVSPAATTPKPYGLITFFVFSAPNKPLDAKRAMVKNVQEAVDGFFGKGEVRTVVIIKEHSDENVGVGGMLRLDAKK